MLFFDFEVFKSDWLVVGIDPTHKKEYVIVNDKRKLQKLYNDYKDDIWVGFNCRNYDQYILKSILLGFNPKEVNDFIIVKKRKGWEYSSLFNKISLSLFDVMPNPPVSLKTLEGFMGLSIHETSVPFSIDRRLTPKEIEETIQYCRFDVLNTIQVFLKRKGEFDAQMDLLKAFNLPLSHLGKTQAQLAAVILDAKAVRFNDDWNIRLPHNVQLGKYKAVGEWFLNPDNHQEDASLVMNIAELEHTIAWGGVHAGRPQETITCADDEVMFDADVGQLYPNIMRIYNLLSRAARKPEMLGYVLDTSMRLKAEGKKKEREPYKRQCNIFYGAEGDKFNPLYDPLHRTLVCVFGQVFLIDLIDKIEDIIVLINSNTDGIFFKCKKKDVAELKRRVSDWEKRTQLEMEYTEFTKFISKDVNNYLAVKADGKIHAKGAYVKDLSDLDYDLPIVNEALRNYMIFGTPVEVTVNSCTDFRKFQKIVKLSAKYEWVEHEQGYNPTYTPRGKRIDNYNRTIKYDNKAYRVFASKDHNDGRLLKCKIVEKENTYNDIGWKTGEAYNVTKKDKFGNTPDNCFIENGDIRCMKIPDKLDRQYYIDLANKRLEDFGL
jgi:DNA polymerase